MWRLDREFLERTKAFAHRVVDVAESIAAHEQSGRMRSRVIDQMVGAGTSVAANTREADEALSRADFCKSLGIVLKELAESRFWLEFVSEREWVKASRVDGLLDEASQLSRIVSTMVGRTRRRDRDKVRPTRPARAGTNPGA